MESAPLRAISDAADLTSGIGTSLYIAPEVESSGKARGSEVNYNDKADMVSPPASSSSTSGFADIFRCDRSSSTRSGDFLFGHVDPSRAWR